MSEKTSKIKISDSSEVMENNACKDFSIENIMQDINMEKVILDNNNNKTLSFSIENILQVSSVDEESLFEKAPTILFEKITDDNNNLIDIDTSTCQFRLTSKNDSALNDMLIIRTSENDTDNRLAEASSSDSAMNKIIKTNSENTKSFDNKPKSDNSEFIKSITENILNEDIKEHVPTFHDGQTLTQSQIAGLILAMGGRTTDEITEHQDNKENYHQVKKIKMNRAPQACPVSGCDGTGNIYKEYTHHKTINRCPRRRGIYTGMQKQNIGLKEECDPQLAEALPKFNRLEQEIKNYTLSKPSKNIPMFKLSNTASTFNLENEGIIKIVVPTRNTASSIKCQQEMLTNTQKIDLNNNVPSLRESLEENVKEKAEDIKRHTYGNSPSVGVCSTRLQTVAPIDPTSIVTVLPKRKMFPTTSHYQKHPQTSTNRFQNMKMSSIASNTAVVSGKNLNPIYSALFPLSYQAIQQLISEEPPPNITHYSHQQISAHHKKQQILQHVQRHDISQVHNQNQHKFQQPSQHHLPRLQHQQTVYDYIQPLKIYHSDQGNTHYHSMISGSQQKSSLYHNITQNEPQTLIPEPEEQMFQNSSSDQQKYNPIPNTKESYHMHPSLPCHQTSHLPQYPHQHHSSTYHNKEDEKYLKQEDQDKDDIDNQKHPTTLNNIENQSDDFHSTQNECENTITLYDLQGNNVTFSTLVEIVEDVLKLEDVLEKREEEQGQGISSSEELKGISDDSKGLFNNKIDIFEAPKSSTEPPKKVSDTSKGTIDRSSEILKEDLNANSTNMPMVLYERTLSSVYHKDMGKSPSATLEKEQKIIICPLSKGKSKAVRKLFEPDSSTPHEKDISSSKRVPSYLYSYFDYLNSKEKSKSKYEFE